MTVSRSPAPYSGFVNAFSEFLSHLVISYDKVVILGDFNVHFENIDDPFTSAIVNILESLGFMQNVVECISSKCIEQ